MLRTATREHVASVASAAVAVQGRQEGNGSLAVEQNAASLVFFGADSNTAFWDTGQQLSSWSLAENKVQVVSLPKAGTRSAWTTLAAKGLAACGVTPRQAASPDDEALTFTSDRTTTGNQVIVWSYPR